MAFTYSDARWEMSNLYAIHIYSLLPENLPTAIYFTMKLIIKCLILVKIIKYCNIDRGVFRTLYGRYLFFAKRSILGVCQGSEFSAIGNFFETVSFIKTFCHCYFHVLDHKVMEWRMSSSLKLIYWKFTKANRQGLVERKSRS